MEETKTTDNSNALRVFIAFSSGWVAKVCKHYIHPLLYKAANEGDRTFQNYLEFAYN
jgi:hypothetical protein